MARWWDDLSGPMLDLIPDWITPNMISVFATSLAVPMVLVVDKHPWCAISLLVVSRLLDAVDGPLARRRGVASEFGAVLDAYLDKVWLVIAFFGIWCRIDPLFSISILTIEGLLVLVRPVKKYYGATSKANSFGGLKVWAQSAGVALVIMNTSFATIMSNGMFAAAMVCGLMSIVYHVFDIVVAYRANKLRTA